MTTEATPTPAAKNKGGRPRRVPTPAAYARLDELLDKVGAVADSVSKLSSRIEAIEQRPANVTQFVPMKPRDTAPNLAGTYEPPEAIQRRAMKGLQRDGDQTSGRTGLWNNPEFLKKIPPQNRPVFKSGDTVRINPDTPIWGSKRTWGDLLADKGIEGIGEVLSIQYMTKTWEPKYTVQVTGLTRRDGDGFRESELMPA